LLSPGFWSGLAWGPHRSQLVLPSPPLFWRLSHCQERYPDTPHSGFKRGHPRFDRRHSATAVGAYQEAATVTFIMLLGEFLEGFTVGKNSKGHCFSNPASPKTAWVRRGEEEIQVPIEDVKPNEVVMLSPGRGSLWTARLSPGVPRSTSPL